jgi:quercetin dioxygenase-like cupin family protein
MTEEKRSNVRRTRRLSGSLLTFLLAAEDETLHELEEFSESGRAAKTLVKQGAMRITLVALRKGTMLESHEVKGPVSIQTIRGCLRLGTDRGNIDIPPSGLISLGPGVVHTAEALDDCSILITFAISGSQDDVGSR